jgi:monoamine oxidase
MRGGKDFMMQVRAVVRAERSATTESGENTGSEFGRRALLQAGAAIGGGAALAGVGALGSPAAAASGSGTVGAAGAAGRRVDRRHPVLIVGAGLAGLSAAYRLAQAGIAVEVHEAHGDRVGGRCWTARGIFGGGQVAEHGGEFIDSEHLSLQRLIVGLGLEREDREHPPAGNVVSGQQSFEVLDGEAITTLPSTDWVKRLTRQAASIGSYDYRTKSAYTRAFDQMSIRDWIIDNDDVTGGAGSEVAARIIWSVGDYWGGDIHEVSALGLVDQFVGPVDRRADERWHIKGGNDQVPQLLRERLEALQPGCIVMDSPLTGLHRVGTSIALRFGGSSKWQRSDQVILAAPFAALRKVDLDPAAFSARKYQAIQEQAIGTNAKILLQFDRRFDHFTIDSGATAGAPWSGVSESDLWHGDSWDSSLTQPGTQGLLTIFTGGAFGESFPVSTAHGPIPNGFRDQTLAYLDRFVPGLAASYTGLGWTDSWVDDPWTHGSYTYFAPGQYTRFSGYNGVAEGGLHFAGEHTSVEWLGYLNGGVQTGERAAREVVATLKGA